MNIKTIITLSLLCHAIMAGAQSTNKSSVSFNVGLQNLHTSDHQFSIFKSYGTILDTRLQFNSIRKKTIWNFDINARAGNLQSDFDIINPSHLAVGSDFKLLYHLADIKQQLPFYLGFSLNSEAYLTRHIYKDVLNSLSSQGTHAFNILIGQSYRLNDKHHFVLTNAYTLFAYIAVHPYSGASRRFNERLENLSHVFSGKVCSLADLFQWQTVLYYQWQFSPRWHLHLQWQLDISKHHIHRHFGKIASTYNIGIGFKLKKSSK